MTRRTLVVEFDVTELLDDEIVELASAVVAQAKGSDKYRGCTVAKPRIVDGVISERDFAVVNRLREDAGQPECSDEGCETCSKERDTIVFLDRLLASWLN